MKWQDFFKVTYHPDPGHYYIHWVSNSRPFGDPFFSRESAERWLSENYQHVLNRIFEEEVFGV